MARGTWTKKLTGSHDGQEEVIFNQDSLEKFVEKIKIGIRDNYTIISLKTLYDKNKNNQNLTADELSVKNHLSGWESKRFNEDVLINKLYAENNSSRYTTFRIGDDISLEQGDKIGSIKFIKNGSSSNILIKGFTNSGHFDNSGSDFAIRDLSARNIIWS